jgi:uncharacterized protein YecA (UPF0149 family)
MASSDSKIENVQIQFKTLATVASSLNTASNEFAKSVAVLDESLKPLNIGLSVWVPFAFADVDPPDYDQDEIGYTKVGGTWGLAIRSVRGREGEDFEQVGGLWLFNDAGREMRLHSVEKIPDVIKALADKASETTKRIQQKTKEVRALAEAIRPAENDASHQLSNIEIMANAARRAAEQDTSSISSFLTTLSSVAQQAKKGAK